MLTLPLTAPASPGDNQAPGTDPNIDLRLNFEPEDHCKLASAAKAK